MNISYEKVFNRYFGLIDDVKTYDEVIEHMIKERKSETDIINNFKEFIKRSEIDV